MQIAIFVGVFLLSAFIAISYIGSVADSGTPFFALSYALFFLVNGVNPDAQLAPPDAFISADGLASAIAGAQTIEFLGLALIILLFTLLIAASASYTRAMIIGVARDAKNEKRTGIIELFRAGRAHWFSSFKVFVPYAVLLWMLIVTSIPVLVMNVHYAVLGAPTPVNVWVVLRIIALISIIAYAAKTVFADGIIAQGSTRPLRESLVYFILHWKRGFGTIAMLLGALFAILFLDYARGYAMQYSVENVIAVPNAIWVIVSVVFFAIVVLWRLWTTFFVVRQVQ